ncbi:MAG TPA: hypothetical protein VGK20_01485 [Candidatus Binatia bacterium]|jgi:hypothetical protein
MAALASLAQVHHRAPTMRFLACLLLVLAATSCSTAYRVVPVANPPATVRYEHGSPTTSLEQRGGGVQVTPLQFDAEGKLVFAVAAYNASGYPANFGTENIQATTALNKALHIYTVDDLAREARNKAIAADVAIVLLGAVAAAASEAGAHQTYRSTFYTPHGTYHYKASYYDAGQAAAGISASAAATSEGIYGVHQALNETIAHIGDAMLQTTTVNPGESVGGRVLVQRAGGKYPPEIGMLIHWNGEDFPFRFQMRRIDDLPAIQADAPPEAAPIASSGAGPLSAKAAAQAVPHAAMPTPNPGSPAQASAQPDRAALVAAPPPPVLAPPRTAADRDEEYNRQLWEQQQQYSR